MPGQADKAGYALAFPASWAFLKESNQLKVMKFEWSELSSFLRRGFLS